VLAYRGRDQVLMDARQNNVEELYSLIKFLQIRPLNDWATFNEQIAKPVKSGRSVRAMKRLQVLSSIYDSNHSADLLFAGGAQIDHAAPSQRPHSKRETHPGPSRAYSHHHAVRIRRQRKSFLSCY
jgi:hypothetical protein